MTLRRFCFSRIFRGVFDAAAPAFGELRLGDLPARNGRSVCCAKAVMAPKPEPPAGQPEALSYYKCNMNTIAGDGVTVPWPACTSRLDVQPELVVIHGNNKLS